jgi:CRP-like cAMP-binding protein
MQVHSFACECSQGNRRSISEFLLPGDGFGFELDRDHADAVQTLMPSTLFATPKEALLKAAATDRMIANLLFKAAARSAEVAEQQSHRLRVMSATENIARFLLEMDGRDITTDVGRLMLTIMGGIAEFERSLIRGRANAGIERAKRQGKKFGRPRAS